MSVPERRVNEQPQVSDPAGESASPGLRARKKAACHRRILDSAKLLFNSPGFDKTTMAAIAQASEVSTPTVFNYFSSKDELLLALVLQVHHETRAAVRDFDIGDAQGPADAICEFLGMYTAMSLEAIGRDTWRHVESTCIRLPDSEFVRRYDAFTAEMLEDFIGFLRESGPQSLGGELDMERIASILFNHWGRLFIELVRDESMSFERHVERLREDLGALFEAIGGSR